MSTLFDAFESSMPKRIELPTVGLKRLEATTMAEALVEMKAKLDIIKERQMFTTFGDVAYALGKDKYLPGMTGKVIAFVSMIGEEYTALIVNGKGQQSSRVAEKHHKTLESWGYKQFPAVKKSKKAQKAQDVREVL